MQQKLVNVLVLIVAAAVVRAADVKVTLSANVEHGKIEEKKEFTLTCKVENYVWDSKAHFLVTIGRKDSTVATWEFKEPAADVKTKQIVAIPISGQSDIAVTNPVAPTLAPKADTNPFPTDFEVKVTPSHINPQDYWCKFVADGVNEVPSQNVHLGNSSYAILPSLLVVALASFVSLKFGIFA